MDGHFVPNSTIGPDGIQALRPHSELPFDVHLMIAPTDPYLEAFAEAGADIITTHVEASAHINRTVQHIKSLGKKAGVALNPGTPAQAIQPILGEIDLVLVMTVNPGFGGQAFIPGQLDKIRELRARIDASGRTIDLEVDGGINKMLAPKAIAAGADALVAGSATFSGSDYGENIAALRGALSTAGRAAAFSG